MLCSEKHDMKIVTDMVSRASLSPGLTKNNAYKILCIADRTLFFESIPTLLQKLAFEII